MAQVQELENTKGLSVVPIAPAYHHFASFGQNVDIIPVKVVYPPFGLW